MKKIMNRNKAFLSLALAAFMALIMSGCGGGGSSSQSAAAGIGRVSAIVKLTGRVGERFAAQTATSTVDVEITISGIYSVSEKEFTPVTTTYPVNLAQGYARVSVVDVPTGVNHLLVAKADWGGGVAETVRAIIPKVTKGAITSVTADAASTVIADAAVYYAQQQGITLSKVTQEKIDAIAGAVASYAKQASYASMTPQSVLTYLQNMNVPGSIELSPTALTIVLGNTSQFTAQIFDLNHTLLTTSVASWGFAPASVGSISSAGLFTAAATGTGSVTAGYQALSASANVTVINVCRADADCSDGLPLTLDACLNPGTINGACAHAPITCNTNSDCNDNVTLTLDVCASGGTVGSACSHTPYACNEALDCNDNNDLTIDTCANPGAANAACGHAAIACNTVADCNDGNALTIDACSNGGALTAACGHTAIACNANADCNDNVASTIDTCSNGGATNASCAHTPAGSVGIDIYIGQPQ